MNTDFEIKLLAECPRHISQLAKLYYEEIAHQWVPNASRERAEQRFVTHINREALPLTFVALQDDQPIGMASLRENDGIRPDLTPWLGSLVVAPHFRGKQIGQILIEAVKNQAKILNYTELYLFAFDPTIPDWYAKLEWKTISNDQFLNHPVTVMQISL
jgi:predicted N-acetyltransferase YhbS